MGRISTGFPLPSNGIHPASNDSIAQLLEPYIDKALVVSREIEAGALFVNTACVGAEIHLPFGGRKGSGNGRREGAHHMLDIYTEWKSVSINYVDTHVT